MEPASGNRHQDVEKIDKKKLSQNNASIAVNGITDCPMKTEG